MPRITANMQNMHVCQLRVPSNSYWQIAILIFTLFCTLNKYIPDPENPNVCQKVQTIFSIILLCLLLLLAHMDHYKAKQHFPTDKIYH